MKDDVNIKLSKAQAEKLYHLMAELTEDDNFRAGGSVYRVGVCEVYVAGDQRRSFNSIFKKLKKVMED